MSVSGRQFFQTFSAVLVQRIVVGDPLAKQQSSNAVRVPNALPQQRRALARDPATVLLIRGWRHCHNADPRLVSVLGHQRAQQRLAVAEAIAAAGRYRRAWRSAVTRIARSLSLRSSRCIISNMARKRRHGELGTHVPPSAPVEVFGRRQEPGAGGDLRAVHGQCPPQSARQPGRTAVRQPRFATESQYQQNIDATSRSGSTTRILVAGSRNAAPARCTSKARRCGPAHCRSRRRPGPRSPPSPGSAPQASHTRCKRRSSASRVPQCGYCVNGWIMTAAALLRDTPHPSEQQIRERLSDLKCRCGTHMAILRAVRRAAQAA